MKLNQFLKLAVLVWLIFTSSLASATFNHIFGRVYHDQNTDSTYNGADTGLAGVKLFLYKDVNDNDSIDAGDSLLDETYTLVGGLYAFLFEHDADHEELVVTVDTSTLISPFTPRGPLHLAYSFTATGSCPDDADFGFSFGECLLYGGNVVYYKEGMPPCEDCEGGLYKLVARLSDTTITQRVKVEIKVSGVTAFTDSVDPGGLIIVQYPDSSVLPDDLDFYINGTLAGSINTTCAQPVGPGVDFGSFEVWRSYSIDLAPVCPPDDGNCGECEGGMKEITFQYNGPLSKPKIKITDKNGTLFHDYVEKGEQFTFTGINGGKMGSEISIFIYNNCYHTKFHTSCSKPIYAGMSVGDLLLVSGQSVKGGYLCTYGEPNDDDCGKCYKYVKSLTLKYVGSHSNPHVIIKKGKKKYWYGKVQKNQEFTIKGSGKYNKLYKDLYFYVNWKKVGKYKMDCSVDLTPGSFLGDFEVVKATTKGDKEICDNPGGGGGTCDECEGGVTYIKFKYTGSDSPVKIKLKGGSTTYFNTNVSTNGTFTIGSKNGWKLEKDIDIYIDDVFHSKIHTSCSKPIGPGTRAGNLLIEESYSKDNGEICPVTPTSGCAQCDDGLKYMTLKYDGTGVNVKIEVKEGGDKVYEGYVSQGDVFTFDADDGKKFKDEIKIKIGGNYVAEFNADCKGKIGAGQVSGDFTLVSATTKYGKVLCDLDVTNCGECEGGLSKLSIRYEGGSTKTVKIVGKSIVYFNQSVAPGTIITIYKGSEKRIMNEIDLYINNVKHTSIHTSCSQPIYPGLVFGNFLIVEAVSNKGGDICPKVPFCFPSDSLNLTYVIGEPDDLGTLLTGGAEIIVDLFDTLLQNKNYTIRAALEGISVSDSAVLDIYESLNGITYSSVKHITVSSTEYSDFTLNTDNKTRYIVIQNPDTNACVSIDAIIYSCDAVPVEMLSFTGYIESPQKSKLFWETSLEVDNEKFIVERRFEHEDAFKQVGVVEGMGNSTVINAYTFDDNISGYQNGNIYYRLKQVDFSGQYEYSDILVLGLLAKDQVVVAPNPAVRATTIVFPQERSYRNYSVEIFNLNGLNVTDQVVKEANDHMLDLNFGTMTGGFYFVRIQNGEQITIKKILIK